MSDHTHTYRHLREETVQKIVWERTVGWDVFDIFFCEECLSYQRVLTRKEEPSRSELGKRIVVWSAGASV
jgi:hypothetical protein